MIVLILYYNNLNFITIIECYMLISKIFFIFIFINTDKKLHLK